MKKSTDITIILDRSGSMSYIADSTIKGFNSFIEEQQNSEGEANLTLVQFDHEYQVLYENVNIKEVKNLTHDTFIPRGSTSLLDAIGVSINNAKNRIKLTPKKQRPDNVIMVIITDGGENTSNKYTREKIFKKISKREAKDNWKFVFIGSNQDAIAVGSSFGISAKRSLTFANDDEGVEMAFASMSKKMSYCVSDDSYDFAFSDEDRDLQDTKLKKKTDFFKDFNIF